MNKYSLKVKKQIVAYAESLSDLHDLVNAEYSECTIIPGSEEIYQNDTWIPLDSNQILYDDYTNFKNQEELDQEEEDQDIYSKEEDYLFNLFDDEGLETEDE
jgi:transcription elongation factor Elf1